MTAATPAPSGLPRRTAGAARASREGELASTSARGLACLERAPLTDGPAAGALILLVHGSMDRSGTFRRTMRHLPDATVLTYDRRGYGESVTAPPSSDFATQVDDLLDVLGGRRAVVVGHSFGGAVVAAAAMRRPDLLGSIVCFEPPQPWQPWWPDTTAARSTTVDDEPGELAERFMRRMVGDQVWDRLPQATRERRRSEGRAFRAEMLSLQGEPVFDAAGITVPVVAAAGAASPDFRLRSVRALADEAPFGHYEEVPGCEHGVHLSHPSALADLARLGLSRRNREG